MASILSALSGGVIYGTVLGKKAFTKCHSDLGAWTVTGVTLLIVGLSGIIFIARYNM